MVSPAMRHRTKGFQKPGNCGYFRMSSDDFGGWFGAAEGIRTPDPIITNDVLYQLSYSGPIRAY